MDRKLRILIIEDEEPIRRGLEDVFIYHGFAVQSESDGTQGLSAALTGNYDLILLDIMLPSLDGFSICNRLREHDRDLPIIMLTAKTADQDIIEGLKLGADDYVAKPFSVQELVLRVQAVLRRSQKLLREESQIQLSADIKLNSVNLKAAVRGSEVELTRRESDILCYLHRNRERPVSRGELLEEVWGYRRASQVDTRTVDIHLAKLRKKLERDPQHPSLLLTVRGEGYQLNSK